MTPEVHRIRHRTSHLHGSHADTGGTACDLSPAPSHAIGHPSRILAPSLASHKCFCILLWRLHTYSFISPLNCPYSSPIVSSRCSIATAKSSSSVISANRYSVSTAAGSLNDSTISHLVLRTGIGRSGTGPACLDGETWHPPLVVGLPRLKAGCVPKRRVLIGDCLASCNWHYIHGFLRKSHSLVGRCVVCCSAYFLCQLLITRNL